jgi:hypothetical protein
MTTSPNQALVDSIERQQKRHQLRQLVGLGVC